MAAQAAAEAKRTKASGKPSGVVLPAPTHASAALPSPVGLVTPPGGAR